MPPGQIRSYHGDRYRKNDFEGTIRPDNGEGQVNDVRELFDDWARSGRADGMERGHGPTARLAFDRLRLTETSRYLDIGCGNGYTVRWAARAVPKGRTVGLDVSEEMIALARRMSDGFPNAHFVAGSFPEANLGDDGFDAIFSMEVFYYLSDLDAAMQKIHDILRPGGSFACVVDYYGENPASHSWPEDLGLPMTLLDAAGWADAFRRVGIAVVEQKRLRLPSDQASAEWKVTQGSLFTLGRR